MRAYLRYLFVALALTAPAQIACSSSRGGGSTDDELGSGGSSSGPEPGACVQSLDACSKNGDCCGFASGQNFCVDVGAGALCAISCSSGSECKSGCCAALEGGGSVCAPESYCSSCVDDGSTCSKNGDCCGFPSGESLCVDGRCSATCSYGYECKSGCCATLEGGGGACGPAYYCG